MTIDWTKPILWDGKPARVLAADLAGQYCYAVAVNRKDRLGEALVAVDRAGRLSNGVCMLTNAPERTEQWAIAYKNPKGPPNVTWGGDAPTVPLSEIIARVRYTFDGDELVDVAIVPLDPRL